MTRARAHRRLALGAAAVALAVPAAASAAPTNGVYQGTIGDYPHANTTAFVGNVRQKRKVFQEVSVLLAVVPMLCDESFGQSIFDTTYVLRHLRIARKRGRYVFSQDQRTVRRVGKRRVTVRRVTVSGVISGDVVSGTLRVDELRRRGNLDGFGRLDARGKVHCTTDPEPFSLPLVPGDLLAPSDAELEDGSQPS